MKGPRFSEERIIGMLKEADCKTSTMGELCRKHGVSEQTFYRWRRKYGGLSMSEARRLKDFKKENSRLKRLLAERDVEIDVMKDLLSKPSEGATTSKGCQDDERKRPFFETELRLDWT